MRFALLVSLLSLSMGQAWASAHEPKILVVVAHPDDEYYFAGFTFWLTHEKNVKIDEVILTSGEGGFRYADLGERLYQQSFKKPEDAKALATRRESEAKGAAKILGIESTEFWHQKDFGFTTDVDVTLKKWDSDEVREKLTQKIKSGHYTGILMLAPLDVTHGHHKAASFLAAEAAQKIPESDRPFLCVGSTDVDVHKFQDTDHENEIKSSRAYVTLKDHDIMRVSDEVKPYRFDRNQTIGPEKKLSYQMIVNMMIAEHKTQGAFQTSVNRDDIEVIRTLSSSGKDGLTRARQFFSSL